MGKVVILAINLSSTELQRPVKLDLAGVLEEPAAPECPRAPRLPQTTGQITYNLLTTQGRKEGTCRGKTGEFRPNVAIMYMEAGQGVGGPRQLGSEIFPQTGAGVTRTCEERGSELEEFHCKFSFVWSGVHTVHCVHCAMLCTLCNAPICSILHKNTRNRSWSAM